MSTDNDVARSLRSWLRESRHEDANRVLDAVFDQVPTIPQRRAGWLARRFPPMNKTLRLALAGVIVVLAAGVGYRLISPGNVGTGPSSSRGPSPTASVPPLPTNSAAEGNWDAPGPPIDMPAGGELISGLTYDSDPFQPQFSFRLAAYGNHESTGIESDWCPVAVATSRVVVIPWRNACALSFSVMRPYEVACGTPDLHPDAATLAAAILANLQMGTVIDGGSLRDFADRMPTFELGDSTGRVVSIDGSLEFDPASTDPASCQLVNNEPGEEASTMDIRGDVFSWLALMDLDGQLVVIRFGSGYDPASVADAIQRGYDHVDDVSPILGTIRDFRFTGQGN